MPVLGPTSYDRLPYPSHPFPGTHPDHLATVATLLGLDPAPADRCRLLELGCAGGGNLIPLALTLPGSTFLGIDLSGEQIAQGNKTVSALRLKNIQLRRLDILDVGDEHGPFDYLICHGVYSWVPARVQDKILEICARSLAPNGVALISYNTYPGWHMRGMIRAMMGFHDRRFRDRAPLERVAQARALLDFLARSAPAMDSPYAPLLRQHLELLQACSDAYLFHEHLEERNEPVYFMNFCERLAAHGLRYLGESEFGTMIPAISFPAEVQQDLTRLTTNLLEMEQYMDFLRNRMFRATLVCHAHVRPCYQVPGERLAAFHVAASLLAASDPPDLSPDVPEDFRGDKGLVLTTATPLVKAALVCLGEAWPRAIPFHELRVMARRRVHNGMADDPDVAAEDGRTLGKALLTAYARAGRAQVELWLRPPCFATEVSERPVASPLARLQAAESHLVTNLRHELVSLNKFEHQLLPLLDGTRDHPALLDGLMERFHQGALHVTHDEVPVTDPARAREIFAEVLARQLPRLAKHALLIA